MKIGIIGLGNMGKAIAKSLNNNQIYFVDNNKIKIHKTKQVADIKQLVKNTDVIIIAVKPQSFHSIQTELSESITAKHTVISIMAGQTIAQIKKGLNTNNIIRSMPNLALAVKQSLTGWYAYKKCSAGSKKEAQKVFKVWGQEIECEHEKQINIITATAGSGPAYYLFVASEIYKFCIKNNFSKKQSLLIAQQVLQGTAAYYPSLSPMMPLDVINQIASKGGTTEAALQYLKTKKVDQHFFCAIEMAKQQANKLSSDNKYEQTSINKTGG